MKRNVSTEFECPPKKMMLDHHSSEQENESFETTPRSMQFVTAAQLTSAFNIHTIPEISDDDLLAMAIAFEKQQNQ